MADKNAKVKENIPGRFYVDQNCIACDACVFSAEHFFAMEDDQGHAYVKKQPETEEEIKDCKIALEGCPVGAIGDEKEDA